MPRFAANLTMLFTEYPFLERFECAARAGFSAVEFLFPYDEDVAAIRHALTRHGLTQVLFNLPAGSFAAGERGFANDPNRMAEFRDGVARALEIAGRLECRTLNCLVGLELSGVPLDLQWGTTVENLRFAAEQAEAAGVLQVVEPLNSIETPGFLLTSTRAALRLLEDVGSDNLKIQYDVYHMQRMEGNLTATLREHIGRIGHVQVADAPARNQPGTGEINYPFVFDALDQMGYAGWIGCEYKPAPSTEQSLDWLRDWGYWT